MDAIEGQVELRLLAGTVREPRTQLLDVEEQKAIRKCEVLLQQPIALEAAARRRQQRLILFETDRADGFRRADLDAAARRAHVIADGVRRDLLVEPRSQIGRGFDEQAQALDRQPIDLHAGRRPQTEPDRRPHLAADRDSGACQRARPGQIFRFGDRERPERYRVRCREDTGRAFALAEKRAQKRAARDRDARLQRPILEVGQKLGHTTGRNRVQKAGVHDSEKVLRELRMARIELQLYARRQECERLDQPLDIGVSDLEGIHAEPRGDARIGARKLDSGLAQKAQFGVVIVEQPRIHGSAGLGIGNDDIRRFDVNLRPEQQPLRRWLAPQLGLDAKHQRISIHTP